MSKQYKLINNITKEETICSLITIDGFDYYVNTEKEQVVLGKKYYESDNNIPIYSFTKETLPEQYYLNSVVATNNLNIDIPKVIENIEIYEYAESLSKSLYNEERHKDNSIKSLFSVACQSGYKKAKETYQYTEKDLEEFYIWKNENRWFNFENGKWNYSFEHGISISTEQYEKNYRKTTKELLDMFKEQQIKVLYYE